MSSLLTVFYKQTFSRLNAIAPLWKVRRKLNFAQVETAYRPNCDQLYTYTNRSLSEIQTPKRWNLIARSKTLPAACVITQQYSSATFVSLLLPK